MIVNILLNLFGVSDARNWNMAGGMSYRTMNGIDVRYIMEYLEGTDENSSKEILKKNREYYIASANKTISRLELAKKRVEYAI